MRISDIRLHGPRQGYVTFVEIVTDTGLVGIGGTDAPRSIVTPIVGHGRPSLRSLLLGENPRDPGRLWRQMFERWPARRGRGGEGGLAINTMAALDLALWDLAGKAAGKPVYELLGGAVQPRVKAYASATQFTVAPDGAWLRKPVGQLVRECEWSMAQGFQAIKFGWGRHYTAEDEPRLRAIRATIGPKTRLMFDHGCPAYWDTRWDVRAAVRASRLLEKYDVHFWEEALPPTDYEGYRQLHRRVRVPLASGESLTTVDQFAPFIERRSLDVVQPDAQQLGLTQFMEIGRRAARARIRCVPHGPWSALTVAAHVQALAALRNGEMIEYPCLASLGTSRRTLGTVRLMTEEIVDHPPVLRDGYLELPARPGLGVGGFVKSALRRVGGGRR